MTTNTLRDMTWEAERFFYREADLLDSRRYKEWLNMLDDNIVYFVPMRRNVKYDELADKETTREGVDISWFEEGKWTLSKRIDQISTGVHWAEEPQSRVSHLISNVQVLAVDEVEGARELTTSSRFLVHQNRNHYESFTFVGRRRDVLRQHYDGWRLRRREVALDQNVLTTKMITVFF